MALTAMPMALGDSTTNHLVSQKVPCLTMFEKARVKSKDSSAKFHWSHFREINTLESRACTFAYAANGEHRKSYPRQRHLLAKSGMTTNINATFNREFSDHGIQKHKIIDLTHDSDDEVSRRHPLLYHSTLNTFVMWLPLNMFNVFSSTLTLFADSAGAKTTEV